MKSTQIKLTTQKNSMKFKAVKEYKKFKIPQINWYLRIRWKTKLIKWWMTALDLPHQVLYNQNNSYHLICMQGE